MLPNAGWNACLASDVVKCIFGETTTARHKELTFKSMLHCLKYRTFKRYQRNIPKDLPSSSVTPYPYSWRSM